jgi:hypothetical protein
MQCVCTYLELHVEPELAEYVPLEAYLNGYVDLLRHAAQDQALGRTHTAHYAAMICS